MPTSRPRVRPAAPHTVRSKESGGRLARAGTRKRKKVSIIILNLNGAHFLPVLFASLAKTTYPNYELIFVDNASTDNSLEVVGKYAHVKVHALKENLGFTGGNNYAIERCDGDYVLLLNNDVIVYPDWLDKLVDAAESDPNVMITGGVIMLMHLFGRTDLKELRRIYDHTVPAHMVSGSCMLIKRDFVNKIGGLHDEYFIYREETEYCWRANMMGYKVLWVHDCYYYHFSGGYTKIRETDKKKIKENLKRFDANYYYYRNEIVYYIRNYNFLNAALSIPRPFLRAGYYFLIERNVFVMQSFLKGLRWILPRSFKLLRQRREVQSQRVVPDSVIFERMREKDFYAERVMAYYKKLEKDLVAEKGMEALNYIPPVKELKKVIKA